MGLIFNLNGNCRADLRDITNEVFNGNLIIKDIQKIDDNINIITENSDFNVRFVEVTDYFNIVKALYKVSDEFLPKLSWNMPIYEMCYDGLASKNWYGIAVFSDNIDVDSSNKQIQHPLSYLDYKMTNKHEIELGIAFCNPNYRKSGLTASLINLLKIMYPDFDIIGGTYAANLKMINLYKKMLFVEESRECNRVDGTESIYFRCKNLFDDSTKFNIRFIHDKDFYDILNLWTGVEGVRVREDEDTQEKINEFLKRNYDTCFAATIGKEIIGTVLCGCDGKRGYLYHMMVSKRYRKNKIGHILLTQVKNTLISKGVSKVSYVIFKDNMLGKKFYDSEGAELRDDLNYYDITIKD